MIKKDDITDYTIPFYIIDGVKYVKLDMIHRFKEFLLGEMKIKEHEVKKRKREMNFTQAEIANMKSLYEIKKQTAWTIAKKYGCSETTVLRAIHGKMSKAPVNGLG